MKRMTDTEKWRDPWFRSLSGPAKYLWIYLLDIADCVGTFEINLDFISQDMGIPIGKNHFQELASRLQTVTQEKYHIPKFIKFQCGGKLGEASPWHRKLRRIVEERKLREDDDGSFFYPTTKKREEEAPGDPQKQPKPPPRRDPIMDALAAHAEASDIMEVTAKKWISIGVAKDQIRKVSPDVTPEEVKRRAENYRSHFQDATLTANALASHWGRCKDAKGATASRPKKSSDGEANRNGEDESLPFHHPEIQPQESQQPPTEEDLL